MGRLFKTLLALTTLLAILLLNLKHFFFNYKLKYFTQRNTMEMLIVSSVESGADLQCICNTIENVDI